MRLYPLSMVNTFGLTENWMWSRCGVWHISDCDTLVCSQTATNVMNNILCCSPAVNGSVDENVQNCVVSEAQPFAIDSCMSAGEPVSLLLFVVFYVFFIVNIIVIWFYYHVAVLMQCRSGLKHVNKMSVCYTWFRKLHFSSSVTASVSTVDSHF